MAYIRIFLVLLLISTSLLFSCSKDGNENSGQDFIEKNPFVIWDKTYGTVSYDEAYDVIKTQDGNLVIAGHSDGGGWDKDEASSGTDFWIFKIDPVGQIIWQKTIGGNLTDYFPVIIETSDGGLLLGGSSNSYASLDTDNPGYKSEDGRGLLDYWIVKLDSEGNLEWDRTFGGNKQERLTALAETLDGYIVGGFSESDISGDKTKASMGGSDAWLLKVNKDGSLLWQRVYGGNSTDELYAIVPSQSGGFILGVYSRSTISEQKSEPPRGSGDYWVLEIDSNGLIIWEKSLGGAYIDYLVDIVQLPDGSLIVGGYSGSGISADKTVASKGADDVWLLRIESGGEITWQGSYGGESDDWLRDLIFADDHLYCAVQSRSTNTGDKTTSNEFGAWDAWYLKIGLDGSLISETTLRGRLQEFPTTLVETADSQLIAVLNSNSMKGGDKTENNQSNKYSIWIVKFFKNWE